MLSETKGIFIAVLKIGTLLLFKEIFPFVNGAYTYEFRSMV